MDNIMVDISNVKGIKEGEEVVIYGRQGEEEITGEDTDAKAMQAAQEQAILEQLTAMEQQQAQPQTPEAIQQQALQAAAQQAQGIPGAQGGF